VQKSLLFEMRPTLFQHVFDTSHWCPIKKIFVTLDSVVNAMVIKLAIQLVVNSFFE